MFPFEPTYKKGLIWLRLYRNVPFLKKGHELAPDFRPIKAWLSHDAVFSHEFRSFVAAPSLLRSRKGYLFHPVPFSVLTTIFPW